MKLKLFTQPSCPNCPNAKQLCEKLENKGINVEYHDIKTEEGLAEALFFNVMSTPSIIVVKDGDEIKSWRGTTPSIQEVLEWLK